MSGPIQLIPPGLLGLLQLKNAGRNPTEFIETIQPTLEMFDWYMQTNYTEFTDSTAAIGAGLTGFFPMNVSVTSANQWLWVDTYGVYGQALEAGVSQHLRCAIRRTAGGATPVHFSGDQVQERAQTVNAVATGSARRFFVPPQFQFGIYLFENTRAVATVFTGNFRVTSLPI